MPRPSKPIIEFTADDARQMVEHAKSIQDGFARVETEKCLQTIQEAAAKGLTSCFINVSDELLSLVSDRLKSVDFQVYHCSDLRNGKTTTVKW